MIRYCTIGLFFFVCTLDSISAQLANNSSKDASTQITDSIPNVQYFVINNFRNDTLTYGYDIYVNGKLYIHQSVVPGIKGNFGFINIEIADKCARLVVDKIKSGQTLPSVSKEDLHKIGVRGAN